MKNYIYLLIVTILFSSCEKVIDVPLENSNPKLVIDANIKWLKNTDGALQTIKLSLTNDFYTNAILPANGAIVTVTNSQNQTFNFLQEATTPNYVCTNFIPQLNEEYTLTVIYENEVYEATARLLQTPEITFVQQETVPGFTGEEEIQIKYFFQDNGQEDNFYLLKVENPEIAYPEYGVVSDEFFQGNLMFGFYPNEVKQNNTLKLSVQGITISYYNFMNKLLNISSQNSGNPFATAPATLRGNILNTSNLENYPLGYFHLCEIDTREYLVE